MACALFLTHGGGAFPHMLMSRVRDCGGFTTKGLHTELCGCVYEEIWYTQHMHILANLLFQERRCNPRDHSSAVSLSHGDPRTHLEPVQQSQHNGVSLGESAVCQFSISGGSVLGTYLLPHSHTGPEHYCHSPSTAACLYATALSSNLLFALC